MNRLGKYGGVSYLLLLIVVLPLAVWRLSLARTFDRWQEIRRSERTIATLSADSSAIETIRFRFDTTELIAGGGLLAASRLEDEWQETEDKLDTMRRLIYI